MNRFTKIVYNCRKATLLIERRQLVPLTIGEKVELKIHLMGCSICRLFQQQSILINNMIKRGLHTPKINIGMDEEFKARLQQQIDQRMNSN